MKPPRQPLIYLTVFLLLTLFFSLNVKSTSTPTFKWSPQVTFKLPAYNTKVSFSDWAYFTSFEWNKWQASKVSFNNLLIGSGESISKIGFASPDTNIAILSANSQSVKLNLAETEKTVYIYDADVKTVQIGGNYFTKDSFYTSFSEWQACSGDGVFQNETLTAIKAGSSTTVTLGFTNPQTIWIEGEGKTARWYFRADTVETAGILGYRLADTASTSTITDEVSSASGPQPSSYGVRVWIVHQNGALDELTNGEPVAIVTRSDDAEGLQNATWNCPGYNSLVYAVMIKVYQRFTDTDWSLRATFITEGEQLIKLPEATWTFHYYTKLSGCKSYLFWGGNYGSGVTITYAEPATWEVMMHKLMKGDILGFLMLPYTWLLGFTAYALVFLLPVGIVLYNRLEDVTATIIALLLIGGFTGGLIGVFVPASGLMLCWILFVLGIAALLYRLIRG